MRKVKSKHRFLEKLSNARKSPFFGRLDFQAESDEAERLYIGLMQIEERNQFYVYDWRAPISSLFYDFGLGAASYEAPCGRIHVAITRRRQFKIVDGVISYSESGTQYTESENHLYYVVCTRAQHRLVVYNPPMWALAARRCCRP